MKKNLTIVLSLLTALILLTTCKKEFVEYPKYEGINPVVRSGQVDNNYIDYKSIDIHAGVFASSKPNSSGSFSITLNDSATQLVSATINGQTPFLMNIIANPSAISQIELNALTTARSLVFLNPAAVVAEPHLSQLVLGLIDELPETQALAAIIDAKLKSDPEVLTKDDVEIKNALLSAVNKFIQKVDELTIKNSNDSTYRKSIEEFRDKKYLLFGDDKLGEQKSVKYDGLTITPVSPFSGLSVSATNTGANKYSISVTNSRKRFVQIYHESQNGEQINHALLPSRKNLLSFNPMQPVTVSLQNDLDITTYSTSTVRAYGLGAQDFTSLTNSPDWQNRIAMPVILTVYMDFFNPLWSVVTGTRSVLRFTDGIGKQIIEGVLLSPNFIPAIGVKLSVGDYSGAITMVLLKTVQVLADNPIWVLKLLQEQGFSYLEALASATIMPLRIALIINSAFELGAAVYDFIQSSLFVVFNLTSTSTILPDVTTTSITSITQNSAISGGNVTAQGGTDVNTRGVCWSTSPNPTTSSNKTIDGSGTGEFTSHITGLSENTAYYVRAYAENLAGISYGEEVNFNTLSGETGNVSGSVVDAITLNGLQNVTVAAFVGQNLITSTQTTANGSFDFLLPPADNYKFEFTKPGFITVEYYNIAVTTNQTTYLEAIMQIDENYGGVGNIAGTVVNAFNGMSIPGAELKVRAGINVQTGPVIATTQSLGNGSYQFNNLNAGNYTIEASSSEYITSFFTAICIGGQTTANQNIALTPLLSDEEIRIVLEWGASPSDLDSHLTGPIPGTSNRFHVYYADQTFYHSGEMYANLDHDDTNSYGPETVTIYIQTEGTYRYSVHDYSNSGSSYSLALSNSSASVKVYQGSNLINTFNVPTNTEGTLWTVFELNGTTITPINTMTYESSPGSITKNSDTKLIKNLTPKK